MPRRGSGIFRRPRGGSTGGAGRNSSDEWGSGDEDSAGNYGGSADGIDSDHGMNSGSEGIHSGSEGIESDPTGNKRFARRLRKRFQNRSVDDSDLLNVPRRVNFTQQDKVSARARATSNDSVSYLGDPVDLTPKTKSKFKKIRQRLNPFSGRKAHKSSDDLDSLGLESAERTSGRRGRRGGRDAPSPSAIRNWRKGGGEVHGQNASSGNGSEPPIRNVSFDTSCMDQSMTATQSPASNPPDMLSPLNNVGPSGITTAPRSEGRRARYSVYHGNRAIKKKFRVRPYHVFNEPRYLTEEEIYADSTQPSVFYEFLKSYLHPTMKPSSAPQVPEPVRELFGTPAYDGRIGSMRVEVLGCVSLDRQKPDVCVYLVSGDCAFCTDVIQGYRSPMWPCASRRAAVFPLHHAYIQLFAGVFDVRTRKNKENDVFCGRVSIDIATLRPNTEYDITFPLRASTCVYDRRKRGVIRLRFSLHWFTERGAVLSYFKGPRSLLKSNPLLGGYPTIPCADPKTFRNVAYTVYGADLPGKYSRSSFRATVREFNLYQVNFRFILQNLLFDAILYEKPYISLYLLLGSLYMIWMEAVRLVPAYWLTYILILYGENYYYYVTHTAYNEGYRQLTIFEVFSGLIFNKMRRKSPASNFQPILVPKRAKKRGGRKQMAGPSRLRRLDSMGDVSEEESFQDDEYINQDHKEFPFSERDAYPKFGVEDSLAPSKDGGSTTRLHGRLSVYYQSPVEDETPAANNEGEDESSGGSDDETVITTTGMGDTMFDMDNLEDEDEEEEFPARGSGYGYEDPARARKRGKSRVHLGTPQNNDVAGRKVPPQITMKKMEHLFHKMSLKVAYELVAAPPLISEEEARNLERAAANERVHRDHKDLDESEKAVAASLKRRFPTDEFDRLLALEFKSANPVNRILASFLGPMMRMGRTVIYVIRIAFNATTWRDPFLSFWIFVALFSLLLFLLVFPWRAFFFFITVVLLGPQNFLIRRFLERRAEKLAKKKREEALLAQHLDVADNGSNYGFGSNISTNSGDSGRMRGMFGALPLPSLPLPGITGLARRAVPRRGKRPSIDNMEVMVGERPAFCSDLHGQSSSKRLAPRSVAIPYSRVRKERFYDWPPDPTVSRATPLQLFAPPEPPPEAQPEPQPQPSDEVIDMDDDSLPEFDEYVPPPPPPVYEAPPSPVFDAPSFSEPEQTLRHRSRYSEPELAKPEQDPMSDQDYLAEYESMGYG